MIFYDLEFRDDGKTIEPISLGITTFTGKEIYFVNSEYDWDSSTEWLKVNVKPHLYSVMPVTKDVIDAPAEVWGQILFEWLQENEPLEENGRYKFIGYYADYDHVAIAQLYGTMMNLPANFPMWTRDLKQWIDDLGDPEMPINPFQPEHNALNDARWNKAVYRWLTQYHDHPAWRL